MQFSNNYINKDIIFNNCPCKSFKVLDEKEKEAAFIVVTV